MGGMLVLAYQLFCIFFCRSAEMRGYCLVRLDAAAGTRAQWAFPVFPVVKRGGGLLDRSMDRTESSSPMILCTAAWWLRREVLLPETDVRP